LIDVAQEGLAATVAAIDNAAGVTVQARRADVADGAALGAAVSALAEALGGVDVVVHCAAILGPGAFAAQPAEQFERVVRINLLGTANVIRAALPALRLSHGSIACLASTAAVHGWPGMAAYSATKFGVAGLCDGLRSELRRDGVSLTAVFPLLIDTPLLSGGDTPPILKIGKRLPPQVVVQKTLAGVAAGKARVFIPASVRVIAALHGIAPSLLDWYGRRYGF
jgi:NAD(P)-dependent dehydrogenase (short-subunit alcohol dehydrogenase family)